MWALVLSTILTSAADSLNPFAITQQFVLQGMVKKPKHIWYFIIPTGVTNLIGGFLAYYGLMSLIGRFFSQFIEQHGPVIFTAELILGIAFLIGAGCLMQGKKIDSLKRQIQSLQTGKTDDDTIDRTEAAHKIKSVTPAALVALGVAATISELTTALPYFAFLAILFNYQLTLLQLTIILVIYNTIYMLPLMLLYLVYCKAQDKFEALYTVIKTQIAKWADILAPLLAGIIGVVLVYHSISLLLV